MLSGQTLPLAFYSAVASFGNKLALADHNREVSYRELYGEIVYVSKKISTLGISKGERVVVFFPNSVDFIVVHFAVMFSGAVSVPIEWGKKPKSIFQLLELICPSLIIVPSHLKLDASDLVQLESMCKVLTLDLADLLPALSSEALSAEKITVESAPLDIASILFTTGSTGVPKGVRLTHCNILSAVSNIIEFCGYDQHCFEAITLPLSHSFGLGQAYSMLLCGGGAYIETGLQRPRRLFAAMLKYQATGLPTTPAGVKLLLANYKDAFQSAGRFIKLMMVNSAPLHPDQTHQLIELFPNLDVVVYYGLTEASRSTFANLSRMGETYFRSVGKPMANVSVELMPPFNEVVISGPTVSQGYWGEEDFDTNALGFSVMRSGDIGAHDEMGNLYIVGRIKDQINVGGFKVDPIEVESILARMDEVSAVAVCGKLNEFGEETVVCAVVLRDNADLLYQKLYSFCQSSLEHYKIPTEMLVLTQIPEATNGKVDRIALRQLIQNGSPKKA